MSAWAKGKLRYLKFVLFCFFFFVLVFRIMWLLTAPLDGGEKRGKNGESDIGVIFIADWWEGQIL